MHQAMINLQYGLTSDDDYQDSQGKFLYSASAEYTHPPHRYYDSKCLPQCDDRFIDVEPDNNE
jgi:hypothetical protein